MNVIGSGGDRYFWDSMLARYSASHYCYSGSSSSVPSLAFDARLTVSPIKTSPLWGLVIGGFVSGVCARQGRDGRRERGGGARKGQPTHRTTDRPSRRLLFPSSISLGRVSLSRGMSCVGVCPALNRLLTVVATRGTSPRQAQIAGFEYHEPSALRCQVPYPAASTEQLTTTDRQWNDRSNQGPRDSTEDDRFRA